MASKDQFTVKSSQPKRRCSHLSHHEPAPAVNMHQSICFHDVTSSATPKYEESPDAHMFCQLEILSGWSDGLQSEALKDQKVETITEFDQGDLVKRSKACSKNSSRDNAAPANPDWPSSCDNSCNTLSSSGWIDSCLDDMQDFCDERASNNVLSFFDSDGVDSDEISSFCAGNDLRGAIPQS